jgi:hypothetical protein
MPHKVIPYSSTGPTRRNHPFPVVALAGTLASATGLVLFVEGSTSAFHAFAEYALPPDWFAAVTACACLLFFAHLGIFSRAAFPNRCSPRFETCYAWASTPTLVAVDLGTLASTVVAVLATGTAFVVKRMCGPFQALAEAKMEEAAEYLALARSYVHRSANATAQFLAEYERWSRTRAYVEKAAFREVRHSPVVIRRVARHLFASTTIADGHSMLAALNATIADAQAQLVGYQGYVDRGARACTDYGEASLALSRMTAGIVLMGLAHYTMSAVHWRYLPQQ